MFDEDIKELQDSEKLLEDYVIGKVKEFLKKDKQEILCNLAEITFKNNINIDNNITLKVEKNGYIIKIRCGHHWEEEVCLILGKNPFIDRLIENITYATNYFENKSRVSNIREIIGRE